MSFNELFYHFSLYILDILSILLLVFITLRLKKVEKSAYPFILSLILYVILSLIGNILLHVLDTLTIFQTASNLEEFRLLKVILSFISGLSPVYSIFILEKNIFKNPLLSKKHLASTLILIIGLIAGPLYLFKLATDMVTYIYYLIVLIEVAFFCGGFLYISYHSTGKVRKYSFSVTIAYLYSLIFSIIYLMLIYMITDGTFPDTLDNFYFIIGLTKLLSIPGWFLLFYSLMKLYSVK